MKSCFLYRYAILPLSSDFHILMFFDIQMKTNHPVKTRQLFNQDNNLSVTSLYCMKFDEIKVAAGGRPTQLPPDVSSSPARNAKHLAVLQDHCINYDLPLHPVQVAVKRADRIAREKKANAVQNVILSVYFFLSYNVFFTTKIAVFWVVFPTYLINYPILGFIGWYYPIYG